MVVVGGTVVVGAAVVGAEVVAPGRTFPLEAFSPLGEEWEGEPALGWADTDEQEASNTAQASGAQIRTRSV